MIAVKSLNITYGDRTIFDDVDIEFKRGTVTVIQGKSGSGKSSLLNVLGLMQTATRCEYTIDNTVVSKFNDTERADYRLHNVGFVFQQSNLIQELTAKENLVVPMSVTGQGNIDVKAEELIRYVGLEEVKNSYPGSLSGGEEQRLAIARAISNDADIILADEPTAALDAENSTKVLELFSRLAHELNKIVILVSHSEFVPKYADVIYEIRDKDLVITKTIATRNKLAVSSVHGKAVGKRKVFRFVRYYTKKRSGDKILNRVFIGVTALVAAAAMLSINFGTNFASESSIVVGADRSVLVVNNTLNLSGKAGQVDYEEALVMSLSDIERIESIPNISKVYPWYNFTSDGVDLNHQTSLASIKILDNGTPIVEKEFGNSFVGELLSPRDRFTVCPLYEEEYQDIASILENKSELDASSGLILTRSLANKLSDNPKELIDKTIEIVCFVPIKVVETDQTIVDNDGTRQRLIDRAYYKLVAIESTVTGILSSSYNSKRTRELDLILMNYEQLSGIIDANKDMHFEENQKELGPSSLVVFVDLYTNVSIVTSQIKNVSASFSVLNNIGTGPIIIGNELAIIRAILLAITIAFVGIIAVMFSMLYHLKNRSRKKEFGILKAIGFTKSNITALTAAEMLKVALPAYVVATIASIIVTVLGNNLSSGRGIFSITFLSVLVGFVVCVVVVVTAGMFPVRSAINVDPIDAIRKINE